MSNSKAQTSNEVVNAKTNKTEDHGNEHKSHKRKTEDNKNRKGGSQKSSSQKSSSQKSSNQKGSNQKGSNQKGSNQKDSNQKGKNRKGKKQSNNKPRENTQYKNQASERVNENDTPKDNTVSSHESDLTRLDESRIELQDRIKYRLKNGAFIPIQSTHLADLFSKKTLVEDLNKNFESICSDFNIYDRNLIVQTESINFLHELLLDFNNTYINLLSDYITRSNSNFKHYAEQYSKLSSSCDSVNTFIAKVETLQHLMDIDETYEHINELNEWTCLLLNYHKQLQCIEHLQDIDQLWNESTKNFQSLHLLETKLIQITQDMEALKTSNSAVTSSLEKLSDNQQEFINSMNSKLSDSQSRTEELMAGYGKLIQEANSSLKTEFSKYQTKVNNRIQAFTEDQSLHLNQIELDQKNLNERYRAFEREFKNQFEDQIADLNKYSTNQTEQLQVLQTNNIELNQKISEITRQVKITRSIAIGSSLVVIIMIVLLSMGVL